MKKLILLFIFGIFSAHAMNQELEDPCAMCHYSMRPSQSLLSCLAAEKNSRHYFHAACVRAYYAQGKKDNCTKCAASFFDGNLPLSLQKLLKQKAALKEECPICLDDLWNSRKVMQCSNAKPHYMHDICLTNWLSQSKTVNCPNGCTSTQFVLVEIQTSESESESRQLKLAQRTCSGPSFGCCAVL